MQSQWVFKNFSTHWFSDILKMNGSANSNFIIKKRSRKRCSSHRFLQTTIQVKVWNRIDRLDILVVTFFEKQFLLGCPKDLCVWMEILLPQWKSKTRTSSQKMLLKELYFLCGSQKKFCAGRTKLFVHFWWKIRKKVFVRVLFIFFSKIQGIEARQMS